MWCPFRSTCHQIHISHIARPRYVLSRLIRSISANVRISFEISLRISHSIKYEQVRLSINDSVDRRSSNKKEESVKCLRVDKIQGQVVNAPNILRATARPTMHLERCFNLIQFMVFKTCQVNELLSVTMGYHALRALCFCELAT